MNFNQYYLKQTRKIKDNVAISYGKKTKMLSTCRIFTNQKQKFPIKTFIVITSKGQIDWSVSNDLTLIRPWETIKGEWSFPVKSVNFII